MPAAMTAAACLIDLSNRLQGAVDEPRLEAERLLAEVTGRPRAWFYSHGEAPLTATVRERVEGLLARRLQGEPMAYLLGTQDFRGLRLRVNPAVLIPRPETEELVEHALHCLRVLERCGRDSSAGREPEPLTLLDLGTGSGAIALALADEAGQATRSCVHVVAVDRSVAALACARDNGDRLGLRVDWRLGDWFMPVRGERFHLIAANPPYVAIGDPHLEHGDLRHEPDSALVSGPDGLDALRSIIHQAPAHLHAGGWLLLEHGYDQAAAVAAELVQAGFQQIGSHADLAGIPRIAMGRWQTGIPERSNEVTAA